MRDLKIRNLIYIIVYIFLLNHAAYAGGVRSIYVKANSVEPIYLSMGKSTILRFKDRPKKVVIGNQNYFGVEFIENDIALQPHGQIKTNMFVYTESRTYGFYLIVGQGRSDDLAKIEWQPDEMKSNLESKKIITMISVKKINDIAVILKNTLKLTPYLIQYSPECRMYILDMAIENLSKQEISLSNLSALIAKDKTSLAKQILVKANETIKANEKTRLRLFFASDKKLDFKVTMTYEKLKGEFILKRKFL